jgi:hypothetical protein
MQSSDRVYFSLLEPGRVPDKKRPYGNEAKYLRELMDARPSAIITVVTVTEAGDVYFDDAGEWLHMLNGRYRHACRRYRANWRSAWGQYLKALPDRKRIGKPTRPLTKNEQSKQPS